jgi:PAS domain S-box-containing protein
VNLKTENTAYFEENAQKDPTQPFVQRYAMALLVTAVLFFLSYYLLVATLDKEAHFVAQINIIGRQNALSQEIAKKAFIIQHCDKERVCRQEISQLEDILRVFENSEKILLKGDELLKLEGAVNEVLDSLRQKNRFYFNPILAASRDLIRLKTQDLDMRKQRIYDPSIDNKIHINIQKILYKEQYFTEFLSALATQYSREAQAYLRRIKFYQTLVLLGGLMVLLLEAIFLFPPILSKLKIYVINLQQAHETEQQKNEELSHAYHQLQVIEEVTRLNAEAQRKTNENLLKTQERLTQAHRELTEKNHKIEEAFNLKSINRQLEEARFFDAAVSQFSDVMRWQANQTIYSWTDNLLATLVPFFDGLQAVIYAYDQDKNSLYVTGGYAVEQETMYHSEVAMGDNLVGQVAKSLKSIYFQELNGQAHKFTATVGTEEVAPRTLIIIPLLFNDGLAGVLEMTATKSWDEKYIELLKRMSESIGTHLSTLQDQMRINQLFADSQMAQKRLRKSFMKIQENEERFRKLSEVTQEGLIFLNENIVKDVNPAIVRMMGYDSDLEMINTHYINLIAPKYRFEIEHKQILNDGFIHETVGLKKHGETFPIEIQAREVRYGNEQMMVISVHDITEKKRTEKELEEANRIARLVTELEKKNKDITASIEYAQRIQEAILPSGGVISGQGFSESFVLSIPKDIVSGDFYWFAEKDDFTLIACADCTGHGVPGALMSIIGYSNLSKLVSEQGITSPETILQHLNHEVTAVLKQQEGNSQSRDGMDVALIGLNLKTLELSFAGAQRPMYWIRNGALEDFKGDSFPIGGNFKFKKQKIFTKNTIQLQEGDTVYMFSDGFPDQFGGKENRKYMSKQMKELLLRLQPYTMDEQKEVIMAEFYNWKGQYKQMDDVLVIGLRV